MLITRIRPSDCGRRRRRRRECGRVLFGSRVAETRSRGHNAKHQLNLDPNPEGTQKTLK